MDQDNDSESVYWAREVLKVDAENTDAHLRPGVRGAGDAVAQRAGGQAASQGARGRSMPRRCAVLDPGPAGPGNR